MNLRKIKDSNTTSSPSFLSVRELSTLLGFQEASVNMLEEAFSRRTSSTTPLLTDIVSPPTQKPSLAVLAPCFSSVHDAVLEVVRHVAHVEIPASKQGFLVLDRHFFMSLATAQDIHLRLGRANTRGLVLLIRHASWFVMCHQIDLTLSRLWTGTTKAPNIPLCIFVHGDHTAKTFYSGQSVNRTKKTLMQSALARYIIEHTAVPAIMFAANLVQIRNCFTEYLEKDKVRESLRWVMGEMSRTLATPYKGRWACSLANKSCEAMPPIGFSKIFSRKRSFSEPRITPAMVNRGFSASVIVGQARRPFIRNLEIAAIQSDLERLSEADVNPSNISLACEPDADQTEVDSLRATELSVFKCLESYQDLIGPRLREQGEYLSQRLHGGDTSKSSGHSFRSCIQWLSQSRTRKTTHLCLDFQVGELRKRQIFRLHQPLSCDELGILRAFYLARYAAYCEKPDQRNRAFKRNRHRAHSVHQSGCGAGWREQKCHLTSAENAKAGMGFRFVQSMSAPAVTAAGTHEESIAHGHFIPWTLGDGRTIVVPKACVHHRKLAWLIVILRYFYLLVCTHTVLSDLHWDIEISNCFSQRFTSRSELNYFWTSRVEVHYQYGKHLDRFDFWNLKIFLINQIALWLEFGVWLMPTEKPYFWWTLRLDPSLYLTFLPVYISNGRSKK